MQHSCCSACRRTGVQHCSFTPMLSKTWPRPIQKLLQKVVSGRLWKAGASGVTKDHSPRQISLLLVNGDVQLQGRKELMGLCLHVNGGGAFLKSKPALFSLKRGFLPFLPSSSVGGGTTDDAFLGCTSDFGLWMFGEAQLKHRRKFSSWL